MLINYGSTKGNKSGVTIYFPMSYSRIPTVLTTDTESSASAGSANVSDKTKVSFKAHVRSSGGYYDDTIDWISIGY